MGDEKYKTLDKKVNATNSRVADLERKVLADNLKDYAYKAITGAVGREYANRLAAWEVHLNSLVGYATTALKRHQDLIDQAKEDKRRDDEMAMFVLSMMGGAALSFVSGIIQYRLGPKFLGNRSSETVIRQVPNPKYVPPTPLPPAPVILPKAARTISPVIPPGKLAPPRTPTLPDAARTISPATPLPKPRTEPQFLDIKREVFDPDYSKVLGKVFGDMGSKMVAGVGTLLPAARPSDAKLHTAIGTVASSTSLKMFEINLRNVWVEANARGATGLQNYANTISNDVNWGDNLLAGNIPGVTPYAGKDPTSRVAEAHYYGEIRKMIDKQREQWAKEWFYYGNDPALISENFAVNALETEMWALWIRSEEFRYTMKQSYMLNYGGKPSFDKVVGNSGLKIDRFAKRLLDLGVIEGNEFLEQWRRNSSQQAVSGVQPTEITNIYGDVDTPEEVQSINEWAGNHSPKILGGRVGSMPRTIQALNHTDIRA